MKCGHLFNGIGGFALAAHWMGWENMMHCEIDPFCNKVMNYHFPNSIQHGDIRTTDFTIWRNRIELITAGWPCQPVSIAGKRKGKEDVRYLWPESIRAIREIQPSIVVGENVRGLTNWQGGVLFDQVQADLEVEGYEVLPFLLPAAGVEAPHQRDRIWFIAHSNRSGFGRFQQFGKDRCQEEAIEGAEQWKEWHKVQRERHGSVTRGIASEGIAADPCGKRLAQRLCAGVGSNGIQERSFTGSQLARTYPKTDWREFPTQSPVCSGNDGLPFGLADITIPKWRKESLKALGNSVVPQIVFQLFKAIEHMDPKPKPIDEDLDVYTGGFDY